MNKPRCYFKVSDYSIFTYRKFLKYEFDNQGMIETEFFKILFVKGNIKAFPYYVKSKFEFLRDGTKQHSVDSSSTYSL